MYIGYCYLEKNVYDLVVVEKLEDLCSKRVVVRCLCTNIDGFRVCLQCIHDACLQWCWKIQVH